MNAHRRLIDFLATAPRTADGFYEFTLPGSYDKAQRFVHYMRVQLTRLKNRKRAEGRSIRPFKMLLISIEPLASAPQAECIIRLQFMFNDNSFAERAINALFEDIEDVFEAPPQAPPAMPTPAAKLATALHHRRTEAE